MEKSPEAFRTITEVSKWLDTPAHVLRFWESRFPEVSPVKRAGGRRYYRPEDMKILGGIKTMLHDKGQSIKDVQDLLSEEGADGIAALSPELTFDTPADSGAGDEGTETSPRLNLVPDKAQPTEADAQPPAPSDIAGVPAPETEADAELEPDLEADAPSDAKTEPAVEQTQPTAQEEEPGLPLADSVPDEPSNSSPEAVPEPEAEAGASLSDEDSSDVENPDLFAQAEDEPVSKSDGFQSRRTQRSAPKASEPEPIRGFFFNDMSEPALPAMDSAIEMDLDRDDPSNYVGFSALNDPEAEPEPQAAPETDGATDAPEKEEAKQTAAPDVPAPSDPLPKDPEEPNLVLPSPPTLAAELRSLTVADAKERMPLSAIAALALRLETLRDRSQDA